MVNLRTVLRWLAEHNLDDNAECWVLTHETVVPIIYATPKGENIDIVTAGVWETPVPIPVTFTYLFDTIVNDYSGGGTLYWRKGYTYRGSYVVNSDNAVFLLFLPDEIDLIEAHKEKMETKKKQAEELERILKNAAG